VEDGKVTIAQNLADGGKIVAVWYRLPKQICFLDSKEYYCRGDKATPQRS